MSDKKKLKPIDTDELKRMFGWFKYKAGMVKYNEMVESGLYSFPKTLVITKLDNDEAEVSTTGGSGASSDSVLLAKVRKHGKEYKMNPNNYDFLANGKEPIIIDEDGGYRHIQYA